jgi:hypothetical protein
VKTEFWASTDEWVPFVQKKQDKSVPKLYGTDCIQTELTWMGCDGLKLFMKNCHTCRPVYTGSMSKSFAPCFPFNSAVAKASSETAVKYKVLQHVSNRVVSIDVEKQSPVAP